MNTDSEYSRGFFDTWSAGMTDAEIWEELKYPVNHGFSVQVCIPKANIEGKGYHESKH